MRKFLLLMFTLLLNLQSAFAFNVDKFIDHKVAPITNFIASLVFYPVKICGYDVPIIIFWILFAGIFMIINILVKKKSKRLFKNIT